MIVQSAIENHSHCNKTTHPIAPLENRACQAFHVAKSAKSRSFCFDTRVCLRGKPP
ncbi:hypothetical protein CPT_Slocum_011 [Serratia phage Slocum]|nr:hypothetical protein CPT_Slocum_011 [Serratia phage Slocum]